MRIELILTESQSVVLTVILTSPLTGADTRTRTEVIGLETQGNSLYTIPAMLLVFKWEKPPLSVALL